MPLWDFQCKTCGCVTEEFHLYEDRPKEIECPACAGLAKYTISVGRAVRAAWSEAGVVFGWDSQECLRSGGWREGEIRNVLGPDYNPRR